MAAFTSFSEEALKRYLKMFGRGELKSYSAITTGIDNSNYWIELAKNHESNEFILTILERLSFDEAPFFGKLLMHLHQYGLPVPTPQTTLDGMTSTIFCGKPCFLIRRLPGEHLKTASVEQCAKIGGFLAAQRKSLSEIQITKPNHYSVAWMTAVLDKQTARLSVVDIQLLKECINLYQQLHDKGLPKGLVHGDLFRDNALFQGGELTGVIDYYRASEDLVTIDLAIAMNDWCRDEHEAPDFARRQAMLDGYNNTQLLSDQESNALIDLQIVAAARFALTRLESGEPPMKDPCEMIDLIRNLIALK